MHRHLLVQVLGTRTQGERRGQALLHDRPRPEDELHEQRGEPRPRPSVAPHVAGRLEGVPRIGHPDFARHQRRPSPVLPCPAHEGGPGRLSGDGLVAEHRRPGTLGEDSGRPRHPPVAYAL